MEEDPNVSPWIIRATRAAEAFDRLTPQLEAYQDQPPPPGAIVLLDHISYHGLLSDISTRRLFDSQQLPRLGTPPTIKGIPVYRVLIESVFAVVYVPGTSPEDLKGITHDS